MGRAKTTRRLITPVHDDPRRTSLHTEPEVHSQRESTMRTFVPRDGHTLPADVLSVVYRLALNLEYRSAQRDRDLVAALIRNATYVYNLHNTYDPALALSEPMLARWKKEELTRRGLSPRSQGDYCSLLRTVAKHNGFAPHLLERAATPRGKAGHPADLKAWATIEDRAATLPHSLRTDVIMLADLTFGVGMRAFEAGQARRDHLTLMSDGEGRLVIWNQRGESRVVPVGPRVTQRILAAQRQPEEFLVRPENSRHNLSHSLFKAAERHRKGITFDLRAARNRYIVNLLGQPIPFSVVCYLADLAPGGHTSQDLTPFALTPDHKRMFEYVRGTWK